MDSTKQYLEDRQVESSGVASEVNRLQSDSTASAAELREFLSQLHDRSPQEVMGAVAQSDLLRSIVTATVGFVALLLVLTVIPYLLKDESAGVTAKPDASTSSGEPAEETPAKADTAASTDERAASDEPDVEKAAEAMGIGGSEAADPDSNPLDSKLDNLLDGIE